MVEPTTWPIALASGTPQSPITHPATLIRDLPADRLSEVERDWAPARARLAEVGDVDHGHWAWTNKIRTVRAGHHRIAAVECEGQIQGLMAVFSQPRPSRLRPDGQVLYVDYLESAPWNLRAYPDGPRYYGLGTHLLAAGVALSLEVGLEGCIGLHSLPQSEPFYLTRCLMTYVTHDQGYYGLAYFEYTEEQARDFLTRSGVPS